MTLATRDTLAHATKSTEAPPYASSTMPLYSRLEPFEGDLSAWPIYEKQAHMSFRVNNTLDEKQRDSFLGSSWTRVLNLLLGPLKPAMPQDKMLSELFTTLHSQFSPTLSTLMERFHFNNRSTQGGGALGQFIAALRGSASTCDFGEQAYSVLRNHFVCSINNPAMHI